MSGVRCPVSGVRTCPDIQKPPNPDWTDFLPLGKVAFLGSTLFSISLFANFSVNFFVSTTLRLHSDIPGWRPYNPWPDTSAWQHFWFTRSISLSLHTLSCMATGHQGMFRIIEFSTQCNGNCTQTDACLSPLMWRRLGTNQQAPLSKLECFDLNHEPCRATRCQPSSAAESLKLIRLAVKFRYTTDL